MTGKDEVRFLYLVPKIVARSSNGRTLDFDSRNTGSIPVRASKNNKITLDTVFCVMYYNLRINAFETFSWMMADLVSR